MEETKPAIQSKTIRLNIMSIIAVGLTALLADPTFTEKIGGLFVMILNVTLILIRTFDTDTKIDGVIKSKPKSNLDILEIDENQSDDSYGINSRKL